MDARAIRAASEIWQGGSSTLFQFGGIRPPRVAVVVGCYDQVAYVETAIRSVAAQSYEDFECVVLDDCSSDGSPDRIREVLASLGDSRFRAILRRENGGQMATMQEGFDVTTGDLVRYKARATTWRLSDDELAVVAAWQPAHQPYWWQWIWD